jgi:hypothetical protein
MQHGTETAMPRAVCDAFDALPRRVRGRKDIESLLHRHRHEWRILAGATASGFIEYLQSLHRNTIHLTRPGLQTRKG